MKNVMLFCGIICMAIFAGMQSYGEHGDHECEPDRWETIEGIVFTSSVLEEPVGQEKKYYGPNTLDENESTAWCVGYDALNPNIMYGIAGLGMYEKIYGIEILPGYAKSAKLFKMNNRPKKILMEIICSENRSWDSQELITYSKEIVLKDERSYQKFFFNGKNTSEIIKDYCVENGFNDYVGDRLKLTILELYKGSKYDDTCISEVRFLDKDGKPMKILPDMKEHLCIYLTNKRTGEPVPGVKYRVEFEDGTYREGILDENGYSKEQDIPRGKIRVKFEAGENLIIEGQEQD